MQRQSLAARYVDLQKLVRLLKDVFGIGNFEIDTQVRPELVGAIHFIGGDSYEIFLGRRR
jgi:hypothetical protein